MGSMEDRISKSALADCLAIRKQMIAQAEDEINMLDSFLSRSVQFSFHFYVFHVYWLLSDMFTKKLQPINSSILVNHNPTLSPSPRWGPFWGSKCPCYPHFCRGILVRQIHEAFVTEPRWITSLFAKGQMPLMCSWQEDQGLNISFIRSVTLCHTIQLPLDPPHIQLTWMGFEQKHVRIQCEPWYDISWSGSIWAQE